MTPPNRSIRNYVATNSAAYQLAGPTLPSSTYTFTISVPDDFTKATAARLKFSRQGDAYSNNLFWNGQTIVCFNSVAFTVYGDPAVCKIMAPGWAAVNSTIGEVETSDPQGLILTLPKSAIKAQNTVVISLVANMYIGDVHLELDFPANYSGTYTKPEPWFGTLSGPGYHPAASLTIGPTAKLSMIGDATLWKEDGMRRALKDPKGVEVKGTMLDVEGEVDSAIGLQAFGKATGIVRVELQLDKKVVQTWTFPYPGVGYWYFLTKVDLSNVPPGTHELFVIAYDSAGVASVPDYDYPSGILDDRKMWFGAYYPARFTLS